MRCRQRWQLKKFVLWNDKHALSRCRDMPSTPLITKKALDKLPHPKEGQALWWDTDLHGFGVRVGVRDKVFILQRDIRGRSRRITLGRYGDKPGELTLQQARRKAEQLAGEMAGGKDPVEQREHATGSGITLRQAWQLYEAHLDAKERSPVTKAGYWLLLRAYSGDWLDRPLIEITPELATGKKIFREFTDRLKTKYKPKDTPEARWAHYSKSPPNQIGFGTLHRLADEASPGWRAAYEEAANKAARQKFVTFTPAMWHDKPVPVRKWCIDGLIPDVNVTALYGDGGIGKTLLAMQLQIAKAIAGFQWLGIQTEPVKSLGVYCEDDADELHRRVTDIAAHYCCTLDRLTNIELTSRVGEENILVHFGKNDIGAPTPFYDELITHALDIAARLVVLDSLHDVFGGDEISRTHARQFVGFLRRLALKLDGHSFILWASIAKRLEQRHRQQRIDGME